MKITLKEFKQIVKTIIREEMEAAQTAQAPQEDKNAQKQKYFMEFKDSVSSLKTANEGLKENFRTFLKVFNTAKMKYTNEEISEQRFSTVVSENLEPIYSSTMAMGKALDMIGNALEGLMTPVSENTLKNTMIENSNFNEYVGKLQSNINAIDEAITNALSTSQIKPSILIPNMKTIDSSLKSIKNILNIFNEDLKRFSRG